MNRLQKKCLFLSLVAHGLLLVGFFFVAAFRPSPPPVPDDLQFIDLTATKFTDEPFSGGGSPGPPAASVPEPIPAPKAAPSPPETKPEPPTPVKPVKAKPAKVVEEEEPVEKPKSPDDWTLTPKPKPEKKFTLVRKTVKERQTAKDDEADEEADRAEKAEKAEKARKADDARKALARARSDALDRVSQRFSGSLSQLRNNLSTGVSIQSVGGAGTGGMGGGEAYNNWTAHVSALYRSYFSPPADAPDSMVAVVEVTILRDGTVVSDPFHRPSGDRDYDRSVSAALRRVRKVPPFPEGAKDTRRVLLISFVPTPKRSLE